MPRPAPPALPTNPRPERPNMNQTYTRTAIALHWLMALGLLAAFSVGHYMHDLPLSPMKLKIYSWHKWAGVTLFLLAVLRFGWRLGHTPPALPDSTPPLQQMAASAVHYLIYLLLFAIPVTGWLMSSAKGFQTVYFGMLPLPDVVMKNKELGEFFEEVHGALNFGLALLVIAHVGAALKHQIIDKDNIMGRMLPWMKRS